MNNYSEKTQNFNYNSCLIVHEMNSFTEFLTCPKFLMPFQPLITTIYSICLIIGSFALNLSLIYLLWTKLEITVFDKILLTHASIDFLISFIDYPFMVLTVYFRYWPFSKWMCIFWMSIDNAFGTLEVFTMLLMSWVRLRCILVPTEYKSEFIVKHIYKSIAIM